MLKDNIRKYALDNAVKHDGKAVLGSIIGKLINEDPSIKNKLKELISIKTRVNHYDIPLIYFLKLNQNLILKNIMLMPLR